MVRVARLVRSPLPGVRALALVASFAAPASAGEGAATGSPATSREDEALAPWTSVSSGDLHTGGVRSDATLWCWGRATNGRLGEGWVRDRIAPTRIAPERGWGSVSDGTAHTCATAADTTLWCWGDGWRGQLGIGLVHTGRYVPTQVGDRDGWATIDVGDPSSCATRDDATLWCWGSNKYGELGIGSADPTRSVPTEVGAGAEWGSVSVGGYGHSAHACAVRTDGCCTKSRARPGLRCAACTASPSSPRRP